MAQTASKVHEEKIDAGCGFHRGRQPKSKPRKFVTYRFVAYIPHHLKSEYQALGWRINEDALAGTHHGDWSVIGEYTTDRDVEPPVPVLRSATKEHKNL